MQNGELFMVVTLLFYQVIKKILALLWQKLYRAVSQF
jgi:hypothetical protein